MRHSANGKKQALRPSFMGPDNLCAGRSGSYDKGACIEMGAYKQTRKATLKRTKSQRLVEMKRARTKLKREPLLNTTIPVVQKSFGT